MTTQFCPKVIKPLKVNKTTKWKIMKHKKNRSTFNNICKGNIIQLKFFPERNISCFIWVRYLYIHYKILLKKQTKNTIN